MTSEQELVSTPPAASAAPAFQSFFMGGFECASHRRRDDHRIDVLSATRHDTRSAEDYALLAQAGIRTVRDGLRWHRIEATEGTYDWSSFLPMLRAAFATGTQVIWDLCHWGVPDWLSPFDPGFPARFAAFSRAAAAVILTEKQRAGITAPSLFCPVNEISFWSWVGGDVEHFFPRGRGRGPELKRQLVRASILAIRAIREIEPGARFIQAEPLIHIAPATRRQTTVAAAAGHNSSQFEAFDMITGRKEPALGGTEDLLDVVGVNYYWNNQWVHDAERAPLGHPLHRPLHELLVELHTRFGRPLVLTETGAEAGAQVGWIGYICAEVRRAQALGAPIHGICLYPVSDYPGWDDDRHCPTGVIRIGPRWATRSLRPEVVSELHAQQQLFSARP